MLLACAHRLTAADALSDRPEHHDVDVYKPVEVPAVATAVRRVADAPAASLRGVPASPVSMQARHPMCFAHAYIRPPAAAFRGGRGNAATFICHAVETAAPGLPGFTLLCPARGSMVLRFRTPAEREAAMRRQPFASRDGSGTVELVRGWGTSVLDDYLVHGIPYHLVRNINDLLVHVALRDYPAEQRTEEEIDANCRGFAWVVDVDPACLAAPDLSAVLCVGHPGEIPRELRIRYADGSASVVPVDVLAVWDWPAAFRAHGGYERFFQPDGAVARAASGLQALSLS